MGGLSKSVGHRCWLIKKIFKITLAKKIKLITHET